MLEHVMVYVIGDVEAILKIKHKTDGIFIGIHFIYLAFIPIVLHFSALPFTVCTKTSTATILDVKMDLGNILILI